MDRHGVEAKYAKLLDELVRMEDEVARRYRLYAEVMLDEPVPEGVDPEYRDLVRDIRAQAELDRRENVLYVFWMRERLTKGPDDLELEEYSEVVAGRALVRLLHYVPRGDQLLAQLDPRDSSWIPSKDDVRRFVLRGGLAETDPERFLARLFSEVPKSRRALYKLLGAYKTLVEMTAEKYREQKAGILPGEELAKRGAVTWDLLAKLLGVEPQPWETDLADERAIETGISLYRMGMSLDEAARLAGAARDRLRDSLKQRGLLRPPGRPRRYRSIGDLLPEGPEGEKDGQAGAVGGVGEDPVSGAVDPGRL